MSSATSAANAVSPIGVDSRGLRILKVLGWIAAGALVLGGLDLLGVDVWGWIAGLWDTVQSVSGWYLIAGAALRTAQTAFISLAWLFILRAAYPHVHIGFAPVFAANAVGTGLEAVLPASLGTVVMLLMFVAIIPGATLAGVTAAWAVEKIFFTVVNVFVYVYLFVAVPGSFSVELGTLRRHPGWTVLIVGGVVALVVVLVRTFWPKLRHLWEDAKQGGAILSSPRDYFVKVVLPSLASYLAKLAIIGVFLAAFAIPVTFSSVMHVVAGNSIAGATAVTPGAAGVTQAISAVALSDFTDAQTATAYSLAQQLVMTAWNVVFAVLLVLLVFGWTNGRALVKSSYAEAKDASQTEAQERQGTPRARGGGPRMTGTILLVLGSFLASAVEMVEALTIVLGVGVVRGWRSTLFGVGAAAVVLAGLIATIGPALGSIPIDALRLVVGALLLVFGLQWLRKAILRSSGYKAHHDEEEAFREGREQAAAAGTDQRAGLDWYSFTVAFKGVLLEGLEVVFIVISFGAAQGRFGPAVLGAAAAVVIVVAAGLLARGPLERVPENAIKFAVGLLLTSFGTFWAAEGAGVDWPGDELSLLAVIAFVGALSFGLVRSLRRQRLSAAPAGAGA